MARYIDADEFLRNMKYLYQFAGFKENEIHFSLLDLQYNVEGESTADVVERKTGIWLNVFHGFGTCSECDRRNVLDNYCPNCGAEMNK